MVTSDSAFTWFHHLVRTFSFKHAVFCNRALQGWWQRSHPSPSWCFLLLWPFADKGNVFISKAPLLLADFCLENENIFITFVFIRIFSSSIHNITSRNHPLVCNVNAAWSILILFFDIDVISVEKFGDTFIVS